MTILSNSDAIQIPGSMISALLLAAGMLSLRVGYSTTVSRFSRNILLIGVVGAVLWDMVLASLIVMSSSGILHGTQAQGQRFWIVAFGGPAVALLALTLFGLTALLMKPMSRLNWLPVLAGIWYPAVYSFLFVYLIAHNGILPEQYWSTVKFTFVIQFLHCACLGLSWLLIPKMNWRQLDRAQNNITWVKQVRASCFFDLLPPAQAYNDVTHIAPLIKVVLRGA